MRGESQNGEISRVFRDAHAFCASLGGGGKSQNDLEQGQLGDNAYETKAVEGTAYSRISGNFAYLCPVGPFQQETAGVQDLAGPLPVHFQALRVSFRATF